MEVTNIYYLVSLYRKRPISVHAGFNSYSVVFEYYRLYSSLTGLAAVKLVFNCTGYTLYELHPLPKSERDDEGLAKLNITLCLPHYFLVPPIEPRLVSNTAYEEAKTVIHNPLHQHE